MVADHSPSKAIRRFSRRRWPTSGFTYLTLMFAVIVVGLAASAAAQKWQTIVLREKEAELLFRGGEIRRGIFAYCIGSRAGMMHCPKSLEDLIKDPGSPGVKRYLRKLYKDPITNDDFDLIQSHDKRFILGVRSKSEGVPLKTADFPPEFDEFEGKGSYAEWEFICRQLRPLIQPHPQAAQQGQTPPPAQPPPPPANPQGTVQQRTSPGDC